MCLFYKGWRFFPCFQTFCFVQGPFRSFLQTQAVLFAVQRVWPVPVESVFRTSSGGSCIVSLQMRRRTEVFFLGQGYCAVALRPLPGRCSRTQSVGFSRVPSKRAPAVFHVGEAPAGVTDRNFWGVGLRPQICCQCSFFLYCEEESAPL